MMKSFQALTVLLGKLRIGQKFFVIDHDEINNNSPFPFPKGRPPWKTGKEYGLGLKESRDWVKRYLTQISDPK